MALTKSINSYVALEEAAYYFEDRLDVDAWTSATETQRSQALVTASSMITEMPWIGFEASPGQPLAFPRTGSYYEPRSGKIEDMSSSYVVTRISQAVMELAYHLLNNDGLLDDTGSVDELQVGSIRLKGLTNPTKLPTSVTSKIGVLAGDGFGNPKPPSNRLWWRAN